MRTDAKGRKINKLVCSSKIFAAELEKYYDQFTGVPDSVLKNTVDYLSGYEFSSRENHAIGVAFGGALVGKKPCVLIQNSGLGLAIDSLLGLFSLYKQGVVLIVSNRGEHDWEEIQHQDWGECTIPILTSLNIPVIDFELQGIESVSEAYNLAYRKNKIVVLLVHRGNLDE
jgi:sulfopyruvate decarboxylase TPP-binding subunit